MPVHRFNNSYILPLLEKISIDEKSMSGILFLSKNTLGDDSFVPFI